MPSKPGIYIYKNSQGNILYVGKAKNLTNRVRSYFQPPGRLGPKTAALVSQINSIEYIEVQSEIEALLLESRLIKKFQPPYNLISKDDKSPYYISLTSEDYPKPIINHDSTHALSGPFLNNLTARRILKQFRRIAPYCQAVRPVKRPCFYSHLGLCNPCPATGNKLAYRKNIRRLRQLLKGRFSQVSSQLNAEMRRYSDLTKYEKAKEIKDYLDSLSYLLTQPVSPDEYIVNPNLVSDQNLAAISSLLELILPYMKINHLHRIEMYDVANLSGTSATASMTVAQEGSVSPRLYRHFTIKPNTEAAGPNDVLMMYETLSRRLKHQDWPTPDLIVLDGGKTQLSIITKLSQEVSSLPPIIGLAKREEIITIPKGTDFTEVKAPLDHPGLQLLQHLRDEAHRFSRRLHHKHRGQSLTS